MMGKRLSRPGKEEPKFPEGVESSRESPARCTSMIHGAFEDEIGDEDKG